VGSDRDPHAQQPKLGWVIVGETCLDRQHKSSHLSVMRTHVLPSGRPSTLQPCANQFKVKEQLSRNGEIGVPCKPAHTLEFNVFERTKVDDKLGMSHEDKQFLKQMNSEFKRLHRKLGSSPTVSFTSTIVTKQQGTSCSTGEIFRLKS
jgi:hypothetical protein